VTDNLSAYTSLRVGGPAERLFKPKTIDELATFLHADDSNLPVIFLGLGSNTLVRDEGVNANVILQGNMNGLTLTEDGFVRAECGVPSPKLARFCAKSGLVGLEFLATVPGLVGGALAMNAGAYDGETWDFVEFVEVINRRGEIFRRAPGEFEVGYRSVIGNPEEWFVSATFSLPEGDAKKSLEKIKGFLDHRANTQPTSESVFIINMNRINQTTLANTATQGFTVRTRDRFLTRRINV